MAGQLALSTRSYCVALAQCAVPSCPRTMGDKGMGVPLRVQYFLGGVRALGGREVEARFASERHRETVMR
jgi:hypothetical protein